MIGQYDTIQSVGDDACLATSMALIARYITAACSVMVSGSCLAHRT